MRKFAALWIVLLALPGTAQEGPRPWNEIIRFTDKAVVGVGFSKDGKHLAMSGNNWISINEIPSGKSVKDLSQYDLVDEALYSLDGKYLVTRSSTNDVVVHSVPDYEKLKFPLETNAHTIRSHKCPASFSPDGRWLVLSNGTTGVRFWRLDGLADKRKYVFETGITDYHMFRNEYLMLPHVNAFAYKDDEVWLGFNDGYVYPISLSLPDVEWNAFMKNKGSGPKQIRREDAGKGMDRPGMAGANFRKPDQAWLFRPHTEHVTSLAFAAGMLVTAGWEGKVKIWKDLVSIRELHDPMNNEAVRGKPKEPFATLPGYFVSLSPDEKILAVAEAWKIRLYDADKLTEIATIQQDPPLGRPVRMRFKNDLLAVTYCACHECVDDNMIRMIGTPPKRVHQHGGPLVVYKR